MEPREPIVMTYRREADKTTSRRCTGWTRGDMRGMTPDDVVERLSRLSSMIAWECRPPRQIVVRWEQE